jgi:hypothetical protein
MAENPSTSFQMAQVAGIEQIHFTQTQVDKNVQGNDNIHVIMDRHLQIWISLTIRQTDNITQYRKFEMLSFLPVYLHIQGQLHLSAHPPANACIQSANAPQTNSSSYILISVINFFLKKIIVLQLLRLKGQLILANISSSKVSKYKIGLQNA